MQLAFLFWLLVILGLQMIGQLIGMIMNAVEFLRVNPNPNEQEIRHALIGNICRCTGYQNIVKAISAAATELNGSAS